MILALSDDSILVGLLMLGCVILSIVFMVTTMLRLKDMERNNLECFRMLKAQDEKLGEIASNTKRLADFFDGRNVKIGE